MRQSLVVLVIAAAFLFAQVYSQKTTVAKTTKTAATKTTIEKTTVSGKTTTSATTATGKTTSSASSTIAGATSTTRKPLGAVGGGKTTTESSMTTEQPGEEEGGAAANDTMSITNATITKTTITGKAGSFLLRKTPIAGCPSTNQTECPVTQVYYNIHTLKVILLNMGDVTSPSGNASNLSSPIFMLDPSFMVQPFNIENATSSATNTSSNATSGMSTVQIYEYLVDRLNLVFLSL